MNRYEERLAARERAAAVHKERVAAAKKIHERARYLRGRFLNNIAVIERDMALLITDYFCVEDENRRRMFFTKVVNGRSFSLNCKKEILIAIVKKDYPRYWDENKNTLKTLDDIMSFRNKLAHSVVDVSEQALARPLDEGIGFIEWKEGEPISDTEFQDWESKCAMVGSCLADIRMLLPFQEVRHGGV